MRKAGYAFLSCSLLALWLHVSGARRVLAAQTFGMKTQEAQTSAARRVHAAMYGLRGAKK